MQYTFSTDDYGIAKQIMAVLDRHGAVGLTGTPAPAPAPALDFPKLRDAVYKLAMQDNGKIKAIAEKYGIKNFKELPEDKYQAAYDEIMAALG